MGSRLMPRKPASGGRTENIMKYMRKFFQRDTVRPMMIKYTTLKTLRGISMRMVWRLAIR